MARSAVTCEHCERHGVPRLVDGREVCRGCGRDVDRPTAVEAWVPIAEQIAPQVLSALSAPGGRRMSIAEVWRALEGVAARTTVGNSLNHLAEQGLVSRDKGKRWGRVRGATNPYEKPAEPRSSARAERRVHVRAHCWDVGEL